ncbi:hypothetical protein TTHERM_01085700 (macronuclear) [Tetrahymena thermophila SB210]|uniref:Kinase domain protein n=1 Tax=Tetrahymena thermophila (strain SB210) TaxID=312017 RepID=Q22BQ0_TETTS|nr:hypothetical protein TTHERM_01085700 [Tetrahymena thermophila SB210]EAR82739.2 hypothetical protein TTHERM_01085700 [Tetrahymena thermophila SB210]|eukprot:XP_001030402.2 hypothetical protein TTHERM_01085700 [Tetrahymena thermophila SB210]
MSIEISFDLDFSQEQIENKLVQNASSTKELSLQYFTIYDISKVLFENKDKFHNLEILKINSCIFEGQILQFLKFQSQLIQIQLEGCWKISSQALLEYVQVANFSNLRSLNLSNTLINDNFIQILSTKENQLEELNISFCNLLSDKGLMVLLSSKQLNKVKTLYLKCLRLTDLTISALIESQNFASTLTKLSIYKCFGCSSESIVHLFQSPVSDKLQYFDASSSLFDDDCIRAIVDKDLKDLKTLKFYECNKVSSEGVKYLFESQIIQRLEVLDISWIYFENNVLEILQNKDLKLKELCFPMVPSIQNETLLKFIQESKLLNTVEVLDLSYNQVDDQIINYILQQKKNGKNIPLRDLQVYGCDKILNKKQLQKDSSVFDLVIYV